MFSVDSTTCGASLPAHSSCTVTVRFTPAAVTASSATLTLNTSTRTATVALNGSGATPAVGVLAVSAPSGAFGSIAVNGTATTTYTFSNTGNGALTFSTGPTLPNAEPFTLATSCGATLAAGSSCTATVTFAPLDNTPMTASFSVDTDVSDAQVFPLSGTGTFTYPGNYVQVASNGLVFSKPATTGSTWASASAYCTTTALAGYTGWRLPADGELKSVPYSAGSAAGWSTTSKMWTSTVNGTGHTARNLNNSSGGYVNSTLHRVSRVKAL